MVSDENILAGQVPPPGDGLDDLQVTKETIGHVESRQLRAEDLE